MFRIVVTVQWMTRTTTVVVCVVAVVVTVLVGIATSISSWFSQRALLWFVGVGSCKTDCGLSCWLFGCWFVNPTSIRELKDIESINNAFREVVKDPSTLFILYTMNKKKKRQQRKQSSHKLSWFGLTTNGTSHPYYPSKKKVYQPRYYGSTFVVIILIHLFNLWTESLPFHNPKPKNERHDTITTPTITTTAQRVP